MCQTECVNGEENHPSKIPHGNRLLRKRPTEDRRGQGHDGAEPVEYLDLDEKSFGRGQSYGSVVSDLAGKRVLEVMQNRDQVVGEGLTGLAQDFPAILQYSHLTKSTLKTMQIELNRL